MQNSPAWSSAFLDEMRGCGDPLADRTVTTILEHHGVQRVNQLLRDFVDHGIDGIPTGDLDPAVRRQLTEFLEVSGRLPEWADAGKIRVGEELFRDNGMMGFSVLSCASLPELYTTGKGGTPVLGATQELDAHTYRRLAETSQMVVDVMQAGGLTTTRKGVRAAQKVRLMHAAIRVLVRTDPAENTPEPPQTLGDALRRRRWDPAWGVPISAEYMGGTLMTFSFAVLRSMRIMGCRFPAEQEEAYLHAWKVTGHVLGVRAEFLRDVNTMEDADSLFSTFLARNRSGSEAEAAPGRRLTATLLRYLEDRLANQLPFGSLEPIQHIPRILMVELLGKETAQLLGVPFAAEDVLEEAVARIAEAGWCHFAGAVSHCHLAAELLFRVTAMEAVRTLPGREKRPFDIPAELADGWGLGNT